MPDMDIKKTNMGGMVKMIKTAILQLNKHHPIKDYKIGRAHV